MEIEEIIMKVFNILDESSSEYIGKYILLIINPMIIKYKEDEVPLFMIIAENDKYISKLIHLNNLDTKVTIIPDSLFVNGFTEYILNNIVPMLRVYTYVDLVNDDDENPTLNVAREMKNIVINSINGKF